MTEYLKLADAKAKKEGSVIVKVIAIGEVKTSKDGKSKRQIITIKDFSGVFEITLWNEEIGKLELNKFYKLENPRWSTYKDAPQLSLGYNCTIHDAVEKNLVGAVGQLTTPETKPEPKESEIKPEPKGPESVNGAELPQMVPQLAELTETETMKILQIKEHIILTIKKYYPKLLTEPNSFEVGMITKEIYRQTLQPNFKKASH